jgi:dTDP-4-dehydrorhamnose reductase
MTLKIGIIGETGQLARALKTCCAEQGLKAISLNRSDLDLTSSEGEIISALGTLGSVDTIINAAAYTAVDQAETDEEEAYRVNTDAVKFIAQYCARKDIAFIHISTDYVFNGQNNSPYKPSDATDPLGIYGHSKLQGERFIRKINGPHAILRTSWVYDGTSKNFMTTILQLAKDQGNLTVVNDQFGRPTYAKHLALACLAMLKPFLNAPDIYSGTYHVSNTGPIISWAEFAKSIVGAAKTHLSHPVKVIGIPASKYTKPAKRPSYSAMDVSQFETQFQLSLPSWSSGLEEAMAEWHLNNIASG